MCYSSALMCTRFVLKTKEMAAYIQCYKVVGLITGNITLQLCTEILKDINCFATPIKSRCVTFEEPSPSSRGGLWPRSVIEPIRSLALRNTLVEICTAVSDHVSQVRKARGKYPRQQTPEKEATALARSCGTFPAYYISRIRGWSTWPPSSLHFDVLWAGLSSAQHHTGGI